MTAQDAPPAPAALEADPAARQFDFWLGDWDVAWGEGQRGRNRVEAILGGHVVLEQFDGRPAMSFQGLSVSVYRPLLKQWRQTWVDDQGSYWAFSGGFAEGRLVLMTDDARDGRPIRLRMVWYDIAADTLDWNWERSDDGGETWQVLWHLHYTRRPPA